MADVVEKRAEVAGIEVVWREAASPTPAPALYLHGVPTSGSDWLPFLARTGGIAPDLPGFGRSGKSAGFDYSIDGYAAWLRAFVDQLGLDRIAMVVHDWGSVGLALAQESPELIERLVVINAVPLLPGYRWHPVARIWRTPVLGELFMGTTTKRGTRFIARRTRSVPEEHIDPWIEEHLPNFDHGTQRAILRLYRSAPSDVLAEAGARLGEITSPALVVWGERDPFLPTRFAHAYAEALGGETAVELVDAGHWPFVDRPDVVARIADFLRGGG